MLSNLLSDLFGFDGVGEFGGEGDVGNGDVVEDEVELFCLVGEVFMDKMGDYFMLGDELGSVELGDDGFEDFVDDGRENVFIVVGIEFLVVEKVGLVKVENGICK